MYLRSLIITPLYSSFLFFQHFLLLLLQIKSIELTIRGERAFILKQSQYVGNVFFTKVNAEIQSPS